MKTCCLGCYQEFRLTGQIPMVHFECVKAIEEVYFGGYFFLTQEQTEEPDKFA